jgi:HEAT repeat protein
MARCLPVLVVFLVLASPLPVHADAGVADADADLRRAKEALKTFRRGFASSDPEERMAALAALAEHDHEVVIREIGEKGLTDEEPEVRDVAARVLGRMTKHPKIAGPLLRDRLAKDEPWPDVQRSIVLSIGRLGYTGAREQLWKALRNFRKERYRFVTDEVLRTVARLKDVALLPQLLQLAEVRGTCPGRPDRPAAERARHGREGYEQKKFERERERPVRPDGQGEVVVLWWKQELDRAVEELTGQEFETAKQFRKWLEKNARKLGIPKRELRRRRLKFD